MRRRSETPEQRRQVQEDGEQQQDVGEELKSKSRTPRSAGPARAGQGQQLLEQQSDSANEHAHGRQPAAK